VAAPPRDTLVWGAVGSRVFAEAPAIVPLYPAVQSPVEVVNVQEYTVAQVVEHLPIINRFEMMLYNGGVLQEIDGAGPYTVFAPADNYYDYVPAQAYLGLTQDERAALARHHVVPRHAVPLNAEGNGAHLTLAGTPLTFEVRESDKSASVEDGFVIKAYQAKNGVVYIISKVLVPDSLPVLQNGRALSVIP
jgi:uncharacterized surface protein with fasciclin (FAS1) repeats